MKKISKWIKGPRLLWPGDIRIRRVFLFFPKTYYSEKNGTKDTRWWEWVWIKEGYALWNCGSEQGSEWRFLDFVDVPELQRKCLIQSE